MTASGAGPLVMPPSRRAMVVALAGAALGGCATVVPPRSVDGGDALSGRLALRVEPLGTSPARAFSAAFDLRGNATAGALGLSTPLGSLLAQAQWSPRQVVLQTPQGTRRFDDLDGLTRELLGESVPVAAWFDWLRGRAWVGAPVASTSRAGFEQLGWAVDLAGFAEGSVVARRSDPAPVVTVRIQLDRS